MYIIVIISVNHKDKIPFCAEHIHGGGTVKLRSTKALVSVRFELLITEL